MSRVRKPIGLVVLFLAVTALNGYGERPNILLIMTDDQGYGDMGVHGNPVIETPNLDRFTEESVTLDRFYVCPVCAPTRASLMTGRYNYRTGAIDTYRGRALMYPDEVTLAEYLGEAGYRTGIFGKWHLGDNYPMRPMDQGFQESLVHRGGGIGQPADPPDNHYTDPVLYRNGREVRTKGYCSDIFTDAAIDFIREETGTPFFVYLPFNCPHVPLEVPDEYYLPYKNMNLSWEMFPHYGHPLMGKFSAEQTARVYGMVTNIDMNLGKLFAALRSCGLEENTLVMFLTDNGPQQARFNGGMKGRKTMVYEGGIRVPGYIRWPEKLQAGLRIEQPLAHIDVLPTLLDFCEIEPREGIQLDGRSFRKLLKDPGSPWEDRNLYFQWHRGDEPQPLRACAARGPRYKMVQARGTEEGKMQSEPVFELYDLLEDPYEQHDLSSEKPAVLEKLKQDYLAWFEDVSSTRGYEVSPIHLGSPHENPVVLTRQDWRGQQAGWRGKGSGYWTVYVEREGVYDFVLKFHVTVGRKTTVSLRVGTETHTAEVAPNAKQVEFEGVTLASGRMEVEPWVLHDGEKLGPMYTEVSFRP